MILLFGMSFLLHFRDNYYLMGKLLQTQVLFSHKESRKSSQITGEKTNFKRNNQEVGVCRSGWHTGWTLLPMLQGLGSSPSSTSDSTSLLMWALGGSGGWLSSHSHGRPRWSSWSLASTWPIPSCWGYLGNESVNWKSLSPSLSFSCSSLSNS